MNFDSENYNNRDLGVKLTSYRKHLKITQRDLARRLNKPQSYVSKIELGLRGLNIMELYKYLEQLNVNLRDFIEEIK